MHRAWFRRTFIVGVLLAAGSLPLGEGLGLGTAVRAAAASKQPHGSRRSTAARKTTAPPQSQAILDDVADRLWERGDFYWHEGRYEERVGVDRLVIRLQPQFIEPYGTAGWLLESLGRKNEALAMYRQGVAAAPDRWETHQDLGMFYFGLKEYGPAAASFQRALEQPGAPAYVWKMRAHALERLGQLQQAVTAWEAAARIAPEDGAIGMNLQRLRSKLKPQE